MNAEQQRLIDNKEKNIHVEKWGPYLSERQWGTVREDYSNNGDAWNYFTHDHSRSRVYRWGEDGLAGISDLSQNICFAISLWNGKDAILKERLFGLTNSEGNHGEDVKELYYYLDNLPSHYYMHYLYKYPQRAFPYEELVKVNSNRSKTETEFELLDTGVFDNNEYFDVNVIYAKESSEDIFIKISITNRYQQSASISLLPSLWFYNKWNFGGMQQKPVLQKINNNCIEAKHEIAGTYYLYFEDADDLFFTENETNTLRITGVPNQTPFVKDAFHDAVIHNLNKEELRAKSNGTKCAPVYYRSIQPNETTDIYLRLTNKETDDPFPQTKEMIFERRKKEANEFYEGIYPPSLIEEEKNIARQAFAGLLWSKQYYHFDVQRWLTSDDGITPVNEYKLKGRNSNWKHLKNQDIICMPDKWEYPWYAAWDLAFHCITMAHIDASFAKNQLLLLTREWYMNFEGQLPAYEWNFSDVNPPVQVWAALQVYEIEKKQTGNGDIDFLKRLFHKLLINFTWWANRKDSNGNNIFEGGFLGLDNIGIFNRSTKLPGESVLEQADGTSWMGFYAMNMLAMALEIAAVDPAFEDSATKFYEQFILIAEALNEHGLWNEEDGFYYDVLCFSNGDILPMKIRSVVGLTPLYGTYILHKDSFQLLKDFEKRKNWFKNYRLKNNLFWPNQESGDGQSALLSLCVKDRLQKLLYRLFDETEFLSPGGIRALSKYYQNHPYSIQVNSEVFVIEYTAGDSNSGMFGGNSNWRGPVWMPVNFLILRSLETYHSFYGDDFKVEFPSGSGSWVNLQQAADLLKDRLSALFKKDDKNLRAIHGKYNWFYSREENQYLVLFPEYFHGDDGRGVGAMHQTGWTSLIANLLMDEK